MATDFDVFPRQALTPRDFKALGRAIRRWLDRCQKANDGVRWYDEESLEQLLKGEPPRALSSAPVGAGAVATADELVQERTGPMIGSDVPSHPSDWVMQLRLVCKAGTRRQMVADIRRALPAELVADVLIDGRSWEEG